MLKVKNASLEPPIILISGYSLSPLRCPDPPSWIKISVTGLVNPLPETVTLPVAPFQNSSDWDVFV